MKVSRYNLYFPLKNKYLVYNTLKDSILVIDEDLKTLLETQNLSDISPDMGKALHECGIIVPDSLDEKALVTFKYQVGKYSTEYVTVLLLPTYACNLSCHYCPNPGEPVFMDSETTQQVVAFLKECMKSARRGLILKLYGGEPLLNVECCTTVCHSLSSFCQTHSLPFFAAAMTNGTLLTAKKPGDVLPYLGAIHVTLDGSQPYHDAVRHYSSGKGTYHDIMEGLCLAREKSMRISVRVNTTPENICSLNDLLGDLRKYKFDEYDKFEIYFGPIAPKEECKHFKDEDSSGKFRKTIYELVPQLWKIVKESGWKGKKRDIITDVRSVQRPVQCQYQKAYTYVIDPRGQFYTCPAFAGDPRYCVGALSDTGPEFTALYYTMHTRDVMLMECGDCAYMPVCGGGCPAAALSHKGGVTDYYCGSIRESTESEIRLYVNRTYPEAHGW
ncbi:MAG: SPASM domain-containing protein [Candidatus Methanofastidiosia archaeon]